MTTIYFIRHSEVFKSSDYNFSSDSLQLQNEKQLLSVNGEIMASLHFSDSQFDDVDFIFSSNYTRCVGTAKYLGLKNNLDIKIVDDFGERKHGINSWSDLPKDFELRQFNDYEYKIGNGESQSEVRDRITNALDKILVDCKNKKVVIVSHATALSFLLKNWCEVNYQGDYKFNNEVFFDGRWNYLETFKLIFDEDQLISIENIKYKE